MKFTSFGIALLLFVTGCASGPELQKYPRRQIDRPYTLPKNVATWTTPVIASYAKDKTNSSFVPPIPVPLFWQIGLTDKLTLNWSPLPLSLSYQFLQDETQVIGASFGTGFGYASGDIGFSLSPGLTAYHRYAFTETVALETSLDFNPTFYFKGHPWRWSAGVDVGPFFQLNEIWYARPFVSVGVQRGYTPVSTAGTSVVPASDETSVIVPLGLRTGWSVSRQWDIGVVYRFRSIGYVDDYVSHSGAVVFTHFW